MDIDPMALDAAMVETAFVQKAREELPNHPFLIQHKGEIPEEFGPHERHDDLHSVLTPAPA